jgi:hypothetical protein
MRAADEVRLNKIHKNIIAVKIIFIIFAPPPPVQYLSYIIV